MPVRIIFTDPTLCVHVCPDFLKDYVIEDIRTRYPGTEVGEVRQVESIHMDPGGMAFVNPEKIQFEIQGVDFSINAEHLLNVREVLSKRYRIVETEHEQLARIYMYWDVLVVPASFLWALQVHLDFNKERGVEKATEIISAISQANERISIPLSNDDDEPIH